MKNTFKKLERIKSKNFVDLGFLVGPIVGFIVGSTNLNEKERDTVTNIFENEKYVESVGKKQKEKFY